MSIWTLIQNYVDETGAKEASIMRRAGLNKGTFTAWRARGVPALPKQEQIVALADALKCDYQEVLIAILHDANYLPEDVARLIAQDQHRADVVNWVKIHGRVIEYLEKAGGDREAARVLAFNARMKDRDPESLNLNAHGVLAGDVDLPPWIEAPWGNGSEPMDEDAYDRELRKAEERLAAERGVDDHAESEGRRGAAS